VRSIIRTALLVSVGLLLACKSIPSDIQALELPYMEGAKITSSLAKSCGYEFTAKKSEAEIKKEFSQAVAKKGWKPSDKKAPEVLYMGMLFEKGDQYLHIHPMSKSGGVWGVIVGLDSKDADIWH
jgi:hypothetical protein